MTSYVDMQDKDADLRDENVFTAVAVQARPPLKVVAYRILHHMDDADDAVQEALWKGYERRDQYDHISTPLAWLFRITANVCLDTFRGKTGWAIRSEVELRIQDPEVIQKKIMRPTQLTDLLDEERNILIKSAIDQLPERQRMAATLHYMHDQTPIEIAESLGVNDGAIRIALLRARRALRKGLEDVGPIGETPVQPAAARTQSTLKAPAA